jgi:hypothetical protein
MRKFFLIFFIFIFSSETFSKSTLPECKGSKIKEYNNCYKTGKYSKLMRLIIFIVSGILWVSTTLAGELITCFTPGEKCTDLIVKQIDEAKKSIYV